MSAVSTFEQTQILAVEPAAAQHLLKQMRNHPKAIGVRIGVKDSGCSGYAYVTICKSPRTISSRCISTLKVCPRYPAAPCDW
jgi:Fe-S cluster assembly iron-binding protein IscA